MLDAQDFDTPESTPRNEVASGQEAKAEEIPLPDDSPDQAATPDQEDSPGQKEPSEEMELTQPDPDLDLGQLKVLGSFSRDRC